MGASLARRGLTALLAAIAASGAGARPVLAEAPPAAPPSVLLVSLDTFRGDYLAASGSSPVATPNLDRLAREGAHFTRARASAPLTLPSHASILTAAWPAAHGLRDNGDGPLAPRIPTLAERLAARGYATAAFVGSFVLDRRFGLGRGFDHYDDAMDGGVAALESMTAERDGAEVVAAFDAWLATSARDQRFFAWVHLYDPHAPYAAPEPYASRHADDPYGAEIAYTDALVGRLLAALEDRGRLASTLVAVVGDHGEGLGEHGEGTHALLIYNSTLTVPLVLWRPGLIAPREVGDLVRTIDLAPTLLELLGDTAGLGDGRSLAPLLAGQSLPAAPALAESRYAERHLGWSPLHAIEEERFKYIAAPAPELYDVVADPGERNNLLAAEPEIGERLAGALGAAVDLAPAAARSAARDEQVAARLRALGYVSGAAPTPHPEVDPKESIELWERLQRAVALVGDGDCARAAPELEAVLRRERGIPLVYETLGGCYMRLERWPEAERLYGAALERGIESAALRIDLGLIEARRQAVERAAAEFERALVLDPLNVAARHHLGDLRRVAGRAREAAEDYRAALALSPRYVYSWNGLGRALADLGDAPAALAAFRHAVELAPDEPHGVLNLAAQLERMGRLEEALAAYRTCLELAPSPELGAVARRGIDRLGGS